MMNSHPRIILCSALVLVLISCTQIMAAVPKNPNTEHYIQIFEFFAPDCPLDQMNSVTLDPIYPPGPLTCISKTNENQYNRFFYSKNSCTKDAAIILSDCDDKCTSCPTKTEMPLNKCVNEKDGTSKIVYCGAMKYDLPKMIWKNTHFVNARNANCASNPIAKLTGDRVVECAKTPFGIYVQRKCGNMSGEQMWDTNVYTDAACTNKISGAKQPLNHCNSYGRYNFECV